MKLDSRELTLPTARAGHTSTLLSDGRVLVVGGVDHTGTAQSSTLIFEPRSGAWIVGPSLAAPCRGHTATLLKDGRVLVVGVGDKGQGAAIYTPRTDTWESQQGPNISRLGHAAVRMPNGSVMVLGGRPLKMPSFLLMGAELPDLSEEVEVFNPAVGTWALNHALKAARCDHMAISLTAGRVFVYGGQGPGRRSGNRVPLRNGELLKPGNVWRTVPRAPGKGGPGVLLSDGRHFVNHGGGLLDLDGQCWREVEPSYREPGAMVALEDGSAVNFGPDGVDRFDLASRAWEPVEGTVSRRDAGATATSLRDGRILLVGGWRDGEALNSAELVGFEESVDDGKEQYTFDDTGATRLLKLLIESERLELEEGFTFEPLVGPIGAVLDFEGGSRTRAKLFMDVLLDSPVVADVFLNDDEARKLMKMW